MRPLLRIATLVGLSASGLGCGRPSSPTAARPSRHVTASEPRAVVAQAEAPTIALVLAGVDAPTNAAWMPNGDVVAVSAGRLWRLRPEETPPRAQTTSLPPGRPALAAARSSDVAVATGGAKAMVFRDGKAALSFDIDTDGPMELSDDGSILVSGRTHALARWRTYDVATGKVLAAIPRTLSLSPGSGAFAITHEGVYDTREGATVVALDAVDGAWVGSKAVMWTETELVVSDPVARATRRVPVDCGTSEERRKSIVDPSSRRALRVCGNRLVVVNLDALEKREFRMPWPVVPSMVFARDSNAVLLGTPGGTIEVDLGTGKSTRRRTLPRARRADGAILIAGSEDRLGVPSPDGRLLLVREPNGSPVVVLDRDAQREVARWAPADLQARADLALFAHEEGLELAVDLGAPAGPNLIRLGPPRRSTYPVPRLTPRAPCPNLPAPYRTILGSLATYTWAPYTGACECTATGCRKPSLLYGTLAHDRGRSLVTPDQSNGLAGDGVVLTDGTAAPIRLPAATPVFGATFLDEGRSAATLSGEPHERDYALREIGLEPLAVTRAWQVPNRGLHSTQLLGTPRHLIVAQASTSSLHASIFPRAGGAPIEVDAWPGQAVIRFEDDRIERVGEGPPPIVCVAPDGVARPFATCSDRLEVRSRLRVD